MFTEYNRAGIYPWADADIVPAVTEISRAAGVPGISVSCYQAGGVGHHKTGRAADFQAGSGPEARDIHTAIARYALDNWDRLNIRYLAWDGWEYGGNYGGPERKRRQQEEAWHASATDPWHARHVHVDFLPGTIPGARPDIRIGAGLVATMSNPALGRVSSEYGWRPRLTLKIKAMFHAGLDIANRTGTPVHAAFAGTVEKAGWNVVPGRTGIGILIRNPDGERQYYGHLSKLRVRAGQVVALGERIGDMGSTGNVTGPHLHFEVWNRTGATLNPRAAFKNHGVNPGVDAPAGPDRKPERVLRTYYGRAVDGQPGHYTYRALQEFLRDRGLYDRAVDGEPGRYMWSGLQGYLTIDGFYTRAVDGDPGRYTWEAIQTWLKAAGQYDRAVDGKPGHYTYRALQSFLAKPRWVTLDKS